jgi:hypothetical protein
MYFCYCAGIEKVVDIIGPIPKVEWDFEGIHYFDYGPPTVQYLFVLDALNFCFWPGMLLVFHGINCSYYVIIVVTVIVGL